MDFGLLLLSFIGVGSATVVGACVAVIINKIIDKIQNVCENNGR